EAGVSRPAQLFRPDSPSRVAEATVCHGLSEDALKQIVEIQPRRRGQRRPDRHIDLELTDAAKTHVVRVGYDPAYGARPLKRVIQKEIETALGRSILEGKIRDGQKVLVDYDAGRRELTFRPENNGQTGEDRRKR